MANVRVFRVFAEVEILGVLLNGVVGKVGQVVFYVLAVGLFVLLGTEPRQAFLEEVNCERVHGGNEDVNA